MPWLIQGDQYIKSYFGKRATVYTIPQIIISVITFTVIVLYYVFLSHVNWYSIQISNIKTNITNKDPPENSEGSFHALIKQAQ